MINKAKKFAEEKHKNQLDDEGKSYFENHLLKVGDAIMKLTNDKIIIASAFLHDTLEDTTTTFEELKKEFGIRVANLVYELTHEGKKDNYGFYFPRLKSKEAIMIKLVDRASNISRMNNWTKERQEHYLRKSIFFKDGKELK